MDKHQKRWERKTVPRVEISSRPKPVFNLYDKLVGIFSPRRALEQARLRGVMRHHLHEEHGAPSRQNHGASRVRKMLKNWLTRGGSADHDSLRDIPLLRERSRDMVRNSPLSAGAISQLTRSVVGEGIRPQSRINARFLGLTPEAAQEWQLKAEELWRWWSSSRNSDFTRIGDFEELTSLAFRSSLENGDTFAIWKMRSRRNWPFETALELIEADRCENPNQGIDGMQSPVVKRNLIWGGVEKSVAGLPAAYWFLKHHPGDFNRATREFFRVRAFASNGEDRIVEHLYHRMRIGQSRGIPYLSPVIEALKKLTDYSESEATAALIASFFTVFIKTPKNTGFADPLDPDGSSNEADPGETHLGAGLIAELNPEESIEIADPKRPNSSYEPFVKAQLREIGVGIDQPVDSLLMAFETSYTSARASLLKAWSFFFDRRIWLVRRLHVPAWRRVISESVAKEMLDAPGFFEDPLIREAYLQAKWIGPAAGQIDPEKEVRAAILRIESGISTLADETAALTGQDWETNHPASAREFAKRLEVGLATPAALRPPITDLAAFRDGVEADQASTGLESDEPNVEKPAV